MSQDTSDRPAPTKAQDSGSAELTGPRPVSEISSFETDPEPPPYEDELIGAVVANRYRVLDKMGEGGMGTVYLAEHVAIEKKIALKVLLAEYARKADLKERFLQEAKAAAKIGHENIVDITDFGHTPNGSVFFAMEFLEGKDLSQAIKAGPMEWARAKPILLQICRAMGAAHAKGIIHRDVKPENIYLIEREGRGDFVKVLDFGIAKMSNVEQSERRLTRTGMIFGTPEYMSPEQAQGHRPDHRVDIYALGVIMYEMLTGHVPFKADTFMGILTKHIFEDPVPPTQIREGIPIEVEEIVLRAMAKDRDDRFRSMTEMAAAITQASGRMTRPTGDLSAVSRPESVTPAPRSQSSFSLGVPLDEQALADELPRSRSKILVAGVVVLLAVAGGAYAMFGRREPPPKPPVSDKSPVPSRPATPTPTPTTPRPPPPPPPPQAPPVAPPPKTVKAILAPSKTVKITISSSPERARIFIGKKYYGKTNKKIELPRGDEKVLLKLRKHRYRWWTKEIVPNRDDTIIATLRKKAASRIPADKPPGKRPESDLIEPKW